MARKRGMKQETQKPVVRKQPKRLKGTKYEEKDNDIEYVKSGKNLIPDMFVEWQSYQDCQTYCDLTETVALQVWKLNSCRHKVVVNAKGYLLTVYGKEDYIGVSLHKAVLASISPLCQQLLKDGRDLTILIMPDIHRFDLLCLMQILYGKKAISHPSQELLQLLGIQFLPRNSLITDDISMTSTAIEAGEESSGSDGSNKETFYVKKSVLACGSGCSVILENIFSKGVMDGVMDELTVQSSDAVVIQTEKENPEEEDERDDSTIPDVSGSYRDSETNQDSNDTIHSETNPDQSATKEDSSAANVEEELSKQTQKKIVAEVPLSILSDLLVSELKRSKNYKHQESRSMSQSNLTKESSDSSSSDSSNNSDSSSSSGSSVPTP